ncbi:MAG: transketolase C-terminal domain-containing protein [candidate division KSB1 bacterium]|nr:transketolase C-terminal domain-containing protein [candidate division KSB1 bacterium]
MNHLELGKANLIVFSETLMKLAEKDKDIVVVTSDSRGSGKLTSFGKQFPDQIVEVGIAEQNLVGVAAGLAAAGKKVFAVSPACFLTARSFEQIKNDVCYSDHPVNLIGISAGVSYGSLGSTHHSLHDIAALRAVNNITIVAPADNFETCKSIKLAAETNCPVYIRFGKKAIEHVNQQNAVFEFGRATILRDGNDLGFIATGETVVQALTAAQYLEQTGISCRVVSMHTIKPLDNKVVIQTARKCKAIITVEEHMVYGGLGEACASLIMQEGISIPFKIVGIPDEYTATGNQLEIFKYYGMNAEGLKHTALQLLADK